MKFHGNTQDNILQKNTFKSPNQAPIYPKVLEPWTGHVPCAPADRNTSQRMLVPSVTSLQSVRSLWTQTPLSQHPRQSIQLTHLPEHWAIAALPTTTPRVCRRCPFNNLRLAKAAPSPPLTS